MLELLHPEIDSQPGMPGIIPQTIAAAVAAPPTGSAVLKIHNETNQINAYTISLECGQTFWQQAWYTLSALTPENPDDFPPQGRRDQRGPQDRTITVNLNAGTTRYILIRFNLPRRADSRVGRYHYKIKVESRVVAGAVRQADRHEELDAILTVRPFYEWEVSATPEKQKVGLRRRRTAFEVAVTNRSNDWLYCDLTIPPPPNLTLDAPTIRLAVPPPEPGELLAKGMEMLPGTQRTVPLLAHTKLRTFQGATVDTPLQVSATRVDAPSVPPAIEDPFYAGEGYVVASTTNDVPTQPSIAVVSYFPPIPASVPQLFQTIGQSAGVIIMSAVGLLALIPMLTLAYEHIQHPLDDVDILQNGLKPGEVQRVIGKFVIGSMIHIKGDFNGKQDEAEIECGQDNSSRQTQGSPNYCSFKVPKEWRGFKGKLTAQRANRILFWPFSLMVPKSRPISYEVSGGDAVVVELKARMLQNTARPGDQIEIDASGSDLGTSGELLVDGKTTQTQWSNSKITFRMPANVVPNSSVTVAIRQNGQIVWSGSLTIIGTGDGGNPTMAQKVAQKIQASAAQKPASKFSPPTLAKTSTTNGNGPQTDPPVPPNQKPTTASTIASIYDHLLREEYEDVEQEADKLKAENNPEINAMKAWALFAQNKDQEGALKLLGEAEKATKDQSSGSAPATVLAAKGYVFDRLGETDNALSLYDASWSFPEGYPLLAYLAAVGTLANIVKEPGDSTYQAVESIYSTLVDELNKRNIPPAIIYYKWSRFYAKRGEKAKAQQYFDLANKDSNMHGKPGMNNLEATISALH